MAHNMESALLITLIGMGFVFVAILLLWGLMALLVKIGSNRADEDDAQEGGEENVAETMTQPVEAVSAYDTGKPLAAAAAVAVAFAMATKQKSLANPFDRPSTSMVSAWQAAGRANQIKMKQTRGRAL